MTATNHALTGAVIGLLIGQPLIAVPAAILSHFVCDALPHYGNPTPSPKLLRTDHFRNYLLVEAGLCFLLVVFLAVSQPQNWLLAAICAFLAAAPDFLWINRFVKARKQQLWRPNIFSKFAAGIQWFQRPIGGVVEAAWFIAGITILVTLLS